MNSAETNSTYNGPGNADDAHKSPERLEQEVNQTRARIEDRLVSLTHRLSPGELLDQALGMAREHGGEFSHNLGSQVKSNPVPLMLTGIGLAWLMMGSKSSPSNSDYPRARYVRGSEYSGDSEYDTYGGSAQYAGEYPPDYETPGSSSPGMVDKAKGALGGVSEKAHGLSDRAHQAAGRMHERAHGASERMHERAHGASERMHNLKDSVGGRVSRASDQLREGSMYMRERMYSSQQQLSDFFREQPILAGGLGIAIGAALGALLPATETEDRLMGRRSADALDKAKSAAGEKFSGMRDKARETATGAMETLKENMHEFKESLHASTSQQSTSQQTGTQQSASEEKRTQQGSGSPYAGATENKAQNNPSAF